MFTLGSLLGYKIRRTHPPKRDQHGVKVILADSALVFPIFRDLAYYGDLFLPLFDIVEGKRKSQLFEINS